MFIVFGDLSSVKVAKLSGSAWSMSSLLTAQHRRGFGEVYQVQGSSWNPQPYVPVALYAGDIYGQEVGGSGPNGS